MCPDDIIWRLCKIISSTSSLEKHMAIMWSAGNFCFLMWGWGGAWGYWLQYPSFAWDLQCTHLQTGDRSTSSRWCTPARWTVPWPSPPGTSGCHKTAGTGCMGPKMRLGNGDTHMFECCFRSRARWWIAHVMRANNTFFRFEEELLLHRWKKKKICCFPIVRRLLHAKKLKQTGVCATLSPNCITGRLNSIS